MADRPQFTHKRERHGLIGPFSGRQLVIAFAAVIVAGVVLVGIGVAMVFDWLALLPRYFNFNTAI